MSMYNIKNFAPDGLVDYKPYGPYMILTYNQDMSVSRDEVVAAFYSAKMNRKKKQIVCDLSQTSSGIVVQAGAMQWMLGDVVAKTDVKSAGSLFKKAATASVTGETAIKPVYTGEGHIALEPTYKHIIPIDIAKWGGSINIADGTFLTCENTIKISVSPMSVSAGLLGGNGFFVTNASGNGWLLLESPWPVEEMLEIDLDDDQIKVDGNLVIAWSKGVTCTVERTTATLIGSAASGEGLVNVYRGTGKVLMIPVK